MSQRIHLDATPGLFHQVLHCHQGDVGRQFEIAVVTRDGYEIPSGATFKIQATKPSGLGFTVTGTAANNIISFTSTEDMTSEAGEIPTQLEIKSGNDVIYTSNFLLVCEKNTHPASITDGSPEETISEITLLVERAESAASTAGADAAAAAQARVDEMMDYLPSEVADLKSDLEQTVKFNSKSTTPIDVSTELDFVNVGKDLSSNGGLTNSSYNCTDYIDLTDVTGIYRTGTEIKYTLWRYAFYNSEKSFLSLEDETTNYDIVDYGDLRVTWLTLNPDARYVRIVTDPTRPFEYYKVTEGEQIDSYTVPQLYVDEVNLHDGAVDGEESKEVLDEIIEKKSTNVLDPSDLTKKGYYLDTSDGVTHIANDSVYLTSKIHIGEAYRLYVRQTFNNSSNDTILIYFYNGDTYLGNRAWTFSLIGSGSKVFELTTPQLATDIVVFTNATGISGSQICISLEELNSFVAYNPANYVKADASANNKYLPLYGKTIANFGDSIFGNNRPPDDVSTALSNITGATVYNLGFGGCRMAQNIANWDAFSMYQLANAIATDDFSVQDAVDIGSVTGMPAYFAETRTLLESIDFSTVDIITISYGTNDFTASVALDNALDPDDTTTFCGALRYSLEKLLTAYPHLHIFVCTPTYRFWLDGNNDFLYDSDTHEINGHLLTEFVEATKDVSKQYHQKSIDNYYELGIDKFNRSHWFLTNDGTHHNAKGSKLIAQHLAIELF